MPMPLQAAVPCARPGAAPTARATRGAMPVRAGSGAAEQNAAGAAVVADSKRNFVYGLHAVNAALERAPERVLELWIVETRDDARTRDLKGRAERAGVHVHSVSGDALAKLVGDVVHQGTAVAMRPLKAWDEHDLTEGLGQLTVDPLLLILDGVTDPHNLGACLRTADAAGVHVVVIPKDRSASVDGVVRKVAAGAAEFIPVATVTNLARTLEVLKERGIWVVGTDGEAEQTLYSADLKRPLALVLGAEGSGMRRLTKDKCDFLVRIPMAGHMPSLNVSVAAGIALFEALRQRAG
jgi:23S rRNA (guanosine2251-2'-O)-methyltransferase